MPPPNRRTRRSPFAARRDAWGTHGENEARGAVTRHDDEPLSVHKAVYIATAQSGAASWQTRTSPSAGMTPEWVLDAVEDLLTLPPCHGYLTNVLSRGIQTVHGMDAIQHG